MKICVTGGTGVVGRGLVPLLLEAGHSVRLVVRRGSRSPAPSGPGCTTVTGNPLDASSMAECVAGCNTVVHLVGTRRREMKATGVTYEDIDVGSARAMAEAMRRTGVNRILLLSAGAIGNSVYVRCKALASNEAIEAVMEVPEIRKRGTPSGGRAGQGVFHFDGNVADR